MAKLVSCSWPGMWHASSSPGSWSGPINHQDSTCPLLAWHNNGKICHFSRTNCQVVLPPAPCPAVLGTRICSRQPCPAAPCSPHSCGSSCPLPSSRWSWPRWRCLTWRSSWGSWSQPPLQQQDHYKDFDKTILSQYYTGHLWRPILMLSLALGLWGIWNTTEPASRSRAMLAISDTWRSPDSKYFYWCSIWGQSMVSIVLPFIYLLTVTGVSLECNYIDNTWHWENNSIWLTRWPTYSVWHPSHHHELVSHGVDIVHLELVDAVVQAGVEQIHEVNQLKNVYIESSSIKEDRIDTYLYISDW